MEPIEKGATGNVTLCVLVKDERQARELLSELADDKRVVACYAELGESKYAVPLPQRWADVLD